jgi:hypothetical protein
MENDTRLLATRLADLLAREHAALADFLVALADFDRERRWVELGHASLFSFLHRELGLSNGAASYRNAAAVPIQRCPEVVAPLRSGNLCLSTVLELSRVLTPENQAAVLPRFLGASKWEAKVIAAELCPAEAPQRRAVVTAVVPALPAVARPTPAAPPLPEPPARPRCDARRSSSGRTPLRRGAARAGGLACARPEVGRERVGHGAARALGEVAPRRGRGAARGLHAGRGQLPVAPHLRRSVRLDEAPPARPHRAHRTRRDLDRR